MGDPCDEPMHTVDRIDRIDGVDGREPISGEQERAGCGICGDTCGFKFRSGDWPLVSPMQVTGLNEGVEARELINGDPERGCCSCGENCGFELLSGDCPLASPRHAVERNDFCGVSGEGGRGAVG